MVLANAFLDARRLIEPLRQQRAPARCRAASRVRYRRSCAHSVVGEARIHGGNEFDRIPHDHMRARCSQPVARVIAPRHAHRPDARAARHFPAGTVHVGVVDPGVGTDRGILLVQTSEQIFLAPDNGLLGPLLSRATDAEIFAVRLERLEQFASLAVSATFHGRDIFAPLAAELAAGRCDP
ncbi:MAG: SAM-dependent chlorinase/fluorinase, partial [Sphingomonadales bacterium]|nr:SAM-dependent chlorinase/fluorinase [Sphingomonadales bacterium]